MHGRMKRNKKITVILPAYNAEKTLKNTLNDIPKECVDDIILVDDASTDNTVSLAKELNLYVVKHTKNRGYGGNQKTCYQEALRRGADIVIMVHPDHQYDPFYIPQLLEPLLNNSADAVFGSRMMIRGAAIRGSMPQWKYIMNIVLTKLENHVLSLQLTEYHSGFRAYSRTVLESVPYLLNSDNFVFDTEIIVQMKLKNFRIKEIPIQARYFKDASTINFFQSTLYGFSIVRTMIKYIFHKSGIKRYEQFSF